MKILNCRAFSLFETVPSCRETIIRLSHTKYREIFYILYFYISSGGFIPVVPVVLVVSFQRFQLFGSTPVFQALAHFREFVTLFSNEQLTFLQPRTTSPRNFWHFDLLKLMRESGHRHWLV